MPSKSPAARAGADAAAGRGRRARAQRLGRPRAAGRRRGRGRARRVRRRRRRRRPEDAPAGAGAGRPEGDPYPAGRPLADVLRAALGSLGAAEPGPGGEPKQAAGGAGACRGGARLALAELVGLTRRARVVVLRPAAPDSAPAPALLAELAGAARALDAALDLAAPMEARARRTRSQQSHAHQGRGPAQAEDLLQTRQRRWIAPGRKAHANQASLWH